MLFGILIVPDAPNGLDLSASLDASSIALVSLAFMRIVYDVVDKVMFVCIFAFISNICDPAIGGTFTTLLAAAYNFGHQWVRYVGTSANKRFLFDKLFTAIRRDWNVGVRVCSISSHFMRL